MNTQDLLNILLVIGFLVIVGCIVFVTFYLIQALKSTTRLADSLENTTQDIRNKLQMKALSLIPAVLIALFSRIFRKKEVKESGR